jgi:hypothetical protein
MLMHLILRMILQIMHIISHIIFYIGHARYIGHVMQENWYALQTLLHFLYILYLF